MAGTFDAEAINKAVSIIEDNIRIFRERIRIISETGPYKKIKQATPGFPMFKPGNTEFYQFAYYEKTLEWYIRDLIVNAIFRELFSFKGIECYWPDISGTICVRYNNESIENIHPMEFILKTTGMRVGYRYTVLTDEEAKTFLLKYNLDRIVILDWSDSESMHLGIKGTGCNADKVYSESIRHFFSGFFSDGLYHIYYEKVLESVRTANEEIGFQTIPRLSLRYLSSFKDDLGCELCDINYRNLRYAVLDMNNAKAVRLNSMSLPNEDYDKLDAQFGGNKRYRALLGTAQFAKCFITAEYMFSVFGEGKSFDYTSVVCGYMKSIEQLLYLIMKYALDTVGNEVLWIKGKYPLECKDRDNMSRKNPDDKRVFQVKFVPENEKYFDLELGSLIYFLRDSNRCLVSANGKKLIHEFLKQYKNECRNEHFHKDNIEMYNG